MTEQPNVVVVLARCRYGAQPFGVRFEEKLPGRWIADWAFAIQEQAASREGYDRASIEGKFGFDPDYPGCPYCFARKLVRCGHCKRVLCYDGKEGQLTCPWCGASGRVTGTAGQVDVSGDR